MVIKDYLTIGRTDSHGGSDLYISFRGEDGKWKRAQNMGENINISYFKGSKLIKSSFLNLECMEFRLVCQSITI